jgi:hypothetical protein
LTCGCSIEKVRPDCVVVLSRHHSAQLHSKRVLYHPPPPPPPPPLSKWFLSPCPLETHFHLYMEENKDELMLPMKESLLSVCLSVSVCVAKRLEAHPPPWRVVGRIMFNCPAQLQRILSRESVYGFVAWSHLLRGSLHAHTNMQPNSRARCDTAVHAPKGSSSHCQDFFPSYQAFRLGNL